MSGCWGWGGVDVTAKTVQGRPRRDEIVLFPSCAGGRMHLYRDNMTQEPHTVALPASEVSEEPADTRRADWGT